MRRGKNYVFSIFSVRSVSRSRAIFVTRGESRLECSAYYCVSREVARDSRRPSENPRERECARRSQTITKKKKKTYEIHLSFLQGYTFSLSSFFPLLLFSTRFFPSIFISTYIRGIERRCFFVPFHVAMYSCALRSCPRSDQTRK